MFSFDNLPNMTTLNARALENVRAMVAWKRQDAGLAGKSGDARPIRSVGIIGAGTMGAEIAAAHIKHNLPVTIFDNNPAALATIARAHVGRTCRGRRERRRSGIGRPAASTRRPNWPKPQNAI